LRVLENKGAKLWFDDDRLNIHAPKGVLTREDLEEVRVRKDAIIEVLQRAANRQTPL
jgi:trimethylamine:corrinoid methyltransferase-like protein